MRRRDGAGRPDTLFIACSALGREARVIIAKYGWDIDFLLLDSRYHLYPSRIEAAVKEKLIETEGDYKRRVVLYGDQATHYMLAPGCEITADTPAANIEAYVQAASAS